MLTKIREKTQGIIATLILSFLTIPFILWGISSYFDSGSAVAVAEVNGVEIDQQQYHNALAQVPGLEQRPESRAIKEMILKNLIDQTLLVKEAEQRGYRLSDARLAETIRTLPYFHRDGKFEPEIYEAVLRQQGMRTSDFEARLRRDSVANQVQQGLSESAFVTEGDVASMVRLMRQERQVTHAVIQPDGFLPKVAVSAAEIEEHYQSNQDAFRTPEAVRVEYVTLSASEIAKQIQPTDTELHQAYETDVARYATPEKRRVSHILISVPANANDAIVKAAQARADDVAKQARAGANFATLATKYSDDKETGAKGGDLGEVARHMLPSAELETAVYGIKPKEIVGPIRSQFGFHVATVTALTPEQRRSFESAKHDLTEQVRKQKAEERFYELSERLRNLAYEHPDGVRSVAKELDLPLQTSDWFTRTGGAGVAAQPRVVTAAFESEVLSQVRNSDIIELKGNELLALHVIARRPSTVRPLTEVRATIERVLKEKHAREQAQAAAAEWIKKLEQGGTLAELARTTHATLQPSKTMTREQATGIDPRLLNAVFAAPRPQGKPVYGQVDLGSQGFVVYALEAVRDIEPSKVDVASKDKLRQQLLQRRGSDYYASYREGLRRDADVKIHANQL
ncbi:MAG: SurA N-terminal domain-containing protein [Gammaproteobacteria bacterium]|nr:SurA N-terminal domain-containing protein [Gammaproteobacteria bacterium]